MAKVKPLVVGIDTDLFEFYPVRVGATEGDEALFAARRQALIEATGQSLVRDDFECITEALARAYGDWKARHDAPDRDTMLGQTEQILTGAQALRGLLDGADEWERLRAVEEWEKHSLVDETLAPDPLARKHFPPPATDVVQRIGMLDANWELMVARQKVLGKEMLPADWDASNGTGRQRAWLSDHEEWLSDDLIEKIYSEAARKISLVGRLIENLRKLEILVLDARQQIADLPTFDPFRPPESHHDILMTCLESVFLRLGEHDGRRWGDKKCSVFAAHVEEFLPKEARATADKLIERRRAKRRKDREQG